MSDFRVFLSAVTSEFGQARDALANDLQAGDTVSVRVQRSFRHDHAAGTLLEKLCNYIKECDIVVCLIGTRGGGGFPTDVEAGPFLRHLPPGVTAASYTQWEFYFARAFNKTPLVYFATNGFRRDKRDPAKEDRPDLQVAHAAMIESLGMQRTPVASRDGFRAAVMRDLLHHRLPTGLSAKLSDTLATVQSKPVLLLYPSLGTLFKGRDAFLQRLRESLTAGGTAAIASKAVHGMGGIGKTRAAVEYAHRYRDDYNAIALLDAETPERLDASLAALAGPLRLAAHAATEQEQKVNAVVDWLSHNPGWFLILDNIDTPPALDAAHRLLGRLRGGHVVLTSRLAVFPDDIAPLDLDVLTLDDAVAYLQEATPNRDDEANARVLARELGQLALALTIAAATIKARKLRFPGIWRCGGTAATG